MTFEELHAKHSPHLLSLATRWLSDRGEAEEIVQESFLAAWRKWDKLDPERIEGWLIIAVQRGCRDLIRKRYTRPGSLFDQIPDRASGERTDELVEDSVFSDAVKTALRYQQELGEKHLEVLELAYGIRKPKSMIRPKKKTPKKWDSRTEYRRPLSAPGLSQAEIAEELGIPLGTVKTRTNDAMRILSKLPLVQSLSSTPRTEAHTGALTARQGHGIDTPRAL